jgi:hypothetical protein
VREQSLAERLKREFGVDADDDDEDKKSGKFAIVCMFFAKIFSDCLFVHTDLKD